MSTRKGSACKTAQKHQNATSYNPAKYGQSRQSKRGAAASVGGLCARCKEKIEWKKKYDKYKPLTVPKKCIFCQERAVKQAYHQVCRSCAEDQRVCSKCGKNEDIVERFAPDKCHKAREEVEFRAELKTLRERERRTLLREQSKETGKVTEFIESDQSSDKLEHFDTTISVS